jgi:hypothetical protein
VGIYLESCNNDKEERKKRGSEILGGIRVKVLSPLSGLTVTVQEHSRSQ